MSETTEETMTLSDVRIVGATWVLVPVSKIENLQAMRFVSYLLTVVGGIVATISYFSFPVAYFLLGLFVTLIGLAFEWKEVHEELKKWVESSRRGTISYTGSTLREEGQ